MGFFNNAVCMNNFKTIRFMDFKKNSVGLILKASNGVIYLMMTADLNS